MSKIALGSDGNGHNLMRALESGLHVLGHQVVVVEAGDNVTDYASVAYKVARSVRDGLYDRGVLICGTGIGMAIAANKVSGVSAAPAHDLYSAERLISSNNGCILTLGQRLIAADEALLVVIRWLECEFDAARSGSKVASVYAVEEAEKSAWRRGELDR